MLFSLCELRLRRFLRRSMMIIAAIPNPINTQLYNSAIQTAAKACTPPFIRAEGLIPRRLRRNEGY